MKIIVRLFGLLGLCFLLLTVRASGQSLSAAQKQEVIDSACRLLRGRYVFPETGRQLAADLAGKSRAGGYAAINDARAFADTLTHDLFRQSRDRHFQVSFDPAWVADAKTAISPADSLALRLKRAEQYRDINYGLRKIRNLDGNIGYLRLTRFSDPVAAGPAIVAAMQTFSASDALIIDLRDNDGGFKEAVDLIASYLFDANQNFTLPYVPGKRLTDIPVYLLINRYTYSAAEGFSQLLKRHRRATLVGENTGGAAHGIARLVLASGFYMNMPVSRPEPDWEGVGIAPDIRVAPAQALSAATIQALRELSRRHPEKSAEYTWLLQDEAAAQHPVTLTEKQLKLYTGSYGQRAIELNQGVLYYHKDGDTPYALLPMGDGLFRFADTDDIRLHFMMQGGQITRMEILYKDGGTKTVEKTGH